LAPRFGIVLCGTSGSSNPLGYDHITLPDLGDDGLSAAGFKLLEFIEKEARVGRKPGTDVMITIFGDFRQFSAKQLAFLSKTSVMIKFLHNLALF
jgi:hypothetical protein